MEADLAIIMRFCVLVLYWDYAFKIVVYHVNRILFRNLNHTSLFQLFFNIKPGYAHLKTFGCLCYPFLRLYNHNKLEPCAIPCMFLGYPSQFKAFWCLEPASMKVYISTHVHFSEKIFPFDKTSKVSQQDSHPSSNTPIPNISYPLHFSYYI